MSSSPTPSDSSSDTNYETSNPESERTSRSSSTDYESDRIQWSDEDVEMPNVTNASANEGPLPSFSDNRGMTTTSHSSLSIDNVVQRSPVNSSSVTEQENVLLNQGHDSNNADESQIEEPSNDDRNDQSDTTVYDENGFVNGNGSSANSEEPWAIEFNQEVLDMNDPNNVQIVFHTLNEFLENLLNEPIDNALVVSSTEILLGAYVFANRHNLNEEARTNFFKFINIMTNRSVIPHSKFLRDKYFYPKESLDYHAVCKDCKSYIKKFSANDKIIVCPECRAENDVKSATYRDFFVVLDIKSQIKLLILKHWNFYLTVLRREGYREGVFRDIYDGLKYREFVDNLPADQKNSYLSFTFNSDGSPVFKSSKYSIWPIQVILNEIPLKEPNKNPITFALWFGKTKPKMTIFLDEFVKRMNQLSLYGITLDTPMGLKNIKVYAICCCVDSGARPDIQGLKQFNGFWGCSWCLQPGTSERLVGNSVVRWPMEVAEARTDMESRFHILSAVVSEQNILGFRTCTPLANLSNFDIIEGFVPDMQHFAHLGLSKRFLQLWAMPGGAYSLMANEIEEINRFLRDIKVPSNVNRLSRTIEERKYWKSREYLNWLLHYSLAALSSFDRLEVYCKHWSLLVQGMHLMMKDTLTREDIDNADVLFRSFATETQQLYGIRQMTYNLHQCAKHLIQSVLNWGPIKSHSGYCFEDGNGKLLKKIHAANGVISQLCRRLILEEGLTIVENYVRAMDEDSPILQFCSDIQNTYTENTKLVGENRYFGKGKLLGLRAADTLRLERGQFQVYKKLLKHDFVYKTAPPVSSRSDNSFAKLSDNRYIRISQFLIHRTTNQELTVCSIVQTEPGIHHCTFVKPVTVISEEVTVVDTNSIIESCVYMEFMNRRIISDIPYKVRFS